MGETKLQESSSDRKTIIATKVRGDNTAKNSNNENERNGGEAEQTHFP